MIASSMYTVIVLWWFWFGLFISVYVYNCSYRHKRFQFFKVGGWVCVDASKIKKVLVYVQLLT